MVSKNRKNIINYRIFHTEILCLCVILLQIFLFVSCRTLPKVQDTFFEDMQFLPLENGASAYFLANVQNARSIIDLLPFEELKNKQTKQLMDRTGYVAAALFPPESGKRFQLAARGNYPSFGAGFAFTFDSNWKKHRSSAGGSYWYSQANKLSISMTSKQVLAVSSLISEPFDILASSSQNSAEIPEGFNEFRSLHSKNASGNTGADFSCWLVNPGDAISDMLNKAGLPIRFPVQEFFFNLYSVSDSKYEAVIRFQFDSATHARGTASILNLASAFGFSDLNFLASLFMSNPSVQNGSSLDFFSNPLDEQEIITLFDFFLAVSR